MSFQVTLNTDPGGQATTLGHAAEMYTQNRADLHLHGGLTPWISDGTPHQWVTPVGEPTPYKKGVSFQNVPDMIGPGKTVPAPAAGDAKGTYYYPNQQSARLMFYHDHAYGITRLNVYAGEAAGYLLVDQVEDDLIDGTMFRVCLIMFRAAPDRYSRILAACTATAFRWSSRTRAS